MVLVSSSAGWVLTLLDAFSSRIRLRHHHPVMGHEKSVCLAPGAAAAASNACSCSVHVHYLVHLLPLAVRCKDVWIPWHACSGSCSTACYDVRRNMLSDTVECSLCSLLASHGFFGCAVASVCAPLCHSIPQSSTAIGWRVQVNGTLRVSGARHRCRSSIILHMPM
jgi:hypothetical protein